MLALLAAMVIVMAVTAFSLHRNSPLVATAPTVTASEPTTDGQGGIAKQPRTQIVECPLEDFLLEFRPQGSLEC
jgi:hypothetical protein